MSSNTLIKLAQYKTNDLSLPLHFHTEYEIILVADGIVEFQVKDNSIIASKGDIVLFNNFESHSTKIIKLPYKRYVLTLSPIAFGEKIEDIELLSLFKARPQKFQHKIYIRHYSTLINLMEQIIQEFCSEETDKYSEELQLMFIKTILIYANRGQLTTRFNNIFEQDVTKLILHMQNLIDKQFSENIKISDICKEFHISVPYFSSQFKLFTGYSPKQYLTQIRLNYVADKIITTSSSITDIAYSAGFSDINNFHRIFKKHFSLTPLEFRKKISASKDDIM